VFLFDANRLNNITLSRGNYINIIVVLLNIYDIYYTSFSLIFARNFANK